MHMKNKKNSKINSINFGLQWISAAVIIGVIIPLVIKLIFKAFCWPLCIVGGVVLLAFVIVFAIEMHQDNGKIPYYQIRLAEDIPFDKETQIAVLKCSICNGEQVAGFKHIETGHFTEVMVIRSEDDLKYFKKIYGVDTLKKEY